MNKPTVIRSKRRTEEVSPIVKLIIVGVLSLFIGFLVFVAMPQKMSVKEFLEHKKSSFNLRGFKISGEVEQVSPGGGYVSVQSSDGRTMGSIKIKQDGESGYVTYDPEHTSPIPQVGDMVIVTGSFERVPSYVMPGKMNFMTLARVDGIKITKPASKEAEK